MYLWNLVKDTFSGWSKHNAQRLGASLAFYTLLSLAPLVIIAVSIAGLMFGQEAAQGQLTAQVSALMGEEGGKAVQELIANASRPSTGIVSAIMGILVLLYGATGVFSELRASLDILWDATPPKTNWLQQVKTKLFSFGMVFAVGFLLLVSLLLSAVLAALGSWYGPSLPLPEADLQILNAIISFAVTVCLFALMYRFVPDKHPPWKDIWVGATVTAALFTLGRFLIGLYLGKSTVSSSYGAAGSLIVVVLWVYYSAQVFFLGASFTKVWSSRRQ
jgi:membrane protein